MQLICKKCGHLFDPAKEMAFCSPYYGHAPAAESQQNLTEALLQNKEKPAKKPQFQSDFRLIWNEPER